MTTTATSVRERPLLMSGPMVRAILSGTKTQTRRVITPQPEHSQVHDWRGKRLRDSEYRMWCWRQYAGQQVQHDHWLSITDQLAPVCPYGSHGDRLWVREAFCLYGAQYIYRANYGEFTPIGDGIGGRWRPSIHMPRHASRLTLEITSVRVERVQSISEEDARAEGVSVARCGCEVCARSSTLCPADASAHIEEYAHLWDSLNAARGYGWDANPWVWAITFKRVEV